MPTYKETVLADAPLVYYRVDDAGSETGGAAKDEGSLKQNGIYQGTVPLVEGLIRAETDKAGSWSNNLANFIEVPDNVGLHLPAEAASYECWAKPVTTAQTGGLIGREVVNTSFDLLYTAGKIFATFRTTGTVNAATKTVIEAEKGIKAHIVATYDGAHARLYYNGALANEVVSTGELKAGTVLVIGRLANSAPFNGVIDEVAVYGTTLSEARVKAHFTAGEAAPPEPEVAASGAMPRAGHKHPAIRIGALA